LFGIAFSLTPAEPLPALPVNAAGSFLVVAAVTPALAGILHGIWHVRTARRQPPQSNYMARPVPATAASPIAVFDQYFATEYVATD
jgi:hypothetical protein